jgi:hypothetical protein
MSWSLVWLPEPSPHRHNRVTERSNEVVQAFVKHQKQQTNSSFLCAEEAQVSSCGNANGYILKIITSKR